MNADSPISPRQVTRALALLRRALRHGVVGTADIAALVDREWLTDELDRGPWFNAKKQQRIVETHNEILRTIMQADSMPVFHARDAFRWRNQVAADVSLLPERDGTIDWEVAGPQMFRELPMVMFALIYTLGIGPELAALLAQRVINEWHDLEPTAGMDGSQIEGEP
jgi:hypothetical protein